MDATSRKTAPWISIVMVVTGVVVCAPASAAVKGEGGVVSTVAAKACLDQKRVIGNRAFRKRYGEKGSLATCIRRARGRARAAVAVAAEECQAELEDYGLEGFLEEYGSLAECIADSAVVDVGDQRPGEAEVEIDDEDFE